MNKAATFVALAVPSLTNSICVLFLVLAAIFAFITVDERFRHGRWCLVPIILTLAMLVCLGLAII